MTQTNLSMRQKQTQRHRKEACGCQRGRRMREGMDWEFGVSRCKHYVENGQTRSFCTAQGIILNIL